MIQGSFCILPHMSTIVGKFKTWGSVDPMTDKDLSMGQRQIAHADLKGMAEAFSALAALYEESQETLDEPSMLQMELEQRVCRECPRHVCCFGRTEMPIGVFSYFYGILKQYGTIYSEDITEEVRMICPQSRRLAATANTAYELIRSRMGELKARKRTQELLASQFQIMSRALMVTAGRIHATARNTLVEDKLLPKLRGLGLRDFTVLCMEDDAGVQVVEIAMRGAGFTKDLVYQVERVCSLCCNSSMMADYDGYGFETGGPNRLRLIPRHKFALEIGTSLRSKEDVCGDSIILATNRYGHSIFGIADGMGTGPSAAKVSRTVSAMCQGAFAMGLPLEDIVQAANGATAILTDGTRYTTLDLVDMDMGTGRAQYHKLCGCPTLLVRRGRVEQLAGSGKPLGMMDQTEDYGKLLLQHGDTLMLCSDGIWNNLPEDKETALCDILTMPDLNQAADIVAGMCKLAASGSEGTQDDMTVMVVRIWEQ